jgi:hypothetical protein
MKVNDLTLRFTLPAWDTEACGNGKVMVKYGLRKASFMNYLGGNHA